MNRISAKYIVSFAGMVLLCMLALTNCTRKEPTVWDSDLLVPLATGRLTLSNVVDDSLLYAEASGLWHVRFERELADFNLDTIVAIEDTSITVGFELPLAGSFNPGFIAPDIVEEINMNVPSAQLRHVRFNRGVLEYRLISAIQGDLICQFSLPGLTRNGVGEEITIQTNPGTSTNPFTHNGSIDLAGYELSLTGPLNNDNNVVETILGIQVDPAADAPATVLINDAVQMELMFIDAGIAYADGYFGQHNYELNELVELDASVDLPQGTLNLNGAVMNVNIRNAVGMDAQLQFEGLRGINAVGNTIDLEHAPLFAPLNISRATRNGSSILAEEHQYELNADNSNLDAFMEFLPRDLNLTASVVLNPLGDITAGNDFIFLDDALSANVILDVPLRIGMENLTFRDTLELTNDAIDALFDGELSLWLRNEFPCSARCTLRLKQEGDMMTVVEGALIDAAAPTTSVGVTQAAESWINISLSQEVLSRLNNTHKLVIDVALETPGPGTVVGIYENYGIDFKLMANGTYTFELGQ
jgi:hypothetical protein